MYTIMYVSRIVYASQEILVKSQKATPIHLCGYTR
jgi:hypothetical protein